MTLQYYDMSQFTPRALGPLNESNKHSKLNSLIDRVSALRVRITSVNEYTMEPVTEIYADSKILQKSSIFLVQHSWDEMLNGIEPTDDEVRMPFEFCAFEFSFSDAYFIYAVQEGTHMLFSNIGNGWGANYLGHIANKNSMKVFRESKTTGIWKMWSNIKCMLVALDAEVAEVKVVRESFTRKNRIKKGQAKLKDHHVVKLTNRHRISNPVGEHSGRHHRQHFRRGHWRHYENHKTWVKWCLAGDPSLGFVDKHYEV